MKDLEFPSIPALLEADKLSDFTKRLEDYVTGVIQWAEENKGGGVDYCVELWNRINALDCWNAFPTSVVEEVRKRLSEEIIAKKRALLDQFEEPIIRELAAAINLDPSKAKTLGVILREHEEIKRNTKIRDYTGQNALHFSLIARPIDGLPISAVNKLIDSRIIDQKGVYTTLGLTRVIVAVLEGELGKEVESLPPEKKINLVKAILAHAKKRPEGADELIREDTVRVGEVLDSASSKAYLDEKRREVGDQVIQILKDKKETNRYGEKAIAFLEQHRRNTDPELNRDLISRIEEERARITIRREATMEGKESESEEVNNATVIRWLEEIGNGMGFEFDILSGDKENYLEIEVSHPTIGLDPAGLRIILVDGNKAIYSSANVAGRCVNVLRLGTSLAFPGQGLQHLLSTLARVLRNSANQAKEGEVRPYYFNGEASRLPLKLMDMFYSYQREKERTKREQQAEFDRSSQQELFVAQISYFRALCREWREDLSPDGIDGIVESSDLPPRIAHASVSQELYLENHIFADRAKEKGLDLMKRLRAEDKQKFIHEVLQLFANCPEENLIQAYYKLISQWEGTPLHGKEV